jgi:hypothetical protein
MVKRIVRDQKINKILKWLNQINIT